MLTEGGFRLCNADNVAYYKAHKLGVKHTVTGQSIISSCSTCSAHIWYGLVMSDLFSPLLSENPLAMTCGTFGTVTGNLGVCYFL